MIRRGMWKTLGVAAPVAVIAFATWATVSVAQEKKDDKAKTETKAEAKNIVETAMADANLKTLVKLLGSAELTETLKGKGPFTLFAPSDEAFNKLPKGELDNLMKSENKAKLQGILKFHVADGKHMAADVAKMKTAKTRNGEATVTVKDGKTMIDKATITKADIVASNGVIHIVDAVNMPKEETKKEEPKKSTGGAH